MASNQPFLLSFFLSFFSLSDTLSLILSLSLSLSLSILSLSLDTLSILSLDTLSLRFSTLSLDTLSRPLCFSILSLDSLGSLDTPFRYSLDACQSLTPDTLSRLFCSFLAPPPPFHTHTHTPHTPHTSRQGRYRILVIVSVWSQLWTRRGRDVDVVVVSFAARKKVKRESACRRAVVDGAMSLALLKQVRQKKRSRVQSARNMFHSAGS